MDGSRFDDLARQLSSRRAAIGGLLAGLLLPTEAAARGKKKHKGKDRDRGKGKPRGQKRASAQEEPCWRAGACIVSKGSNVSQCDLAGYTAPEELNCTRCNLSRANLRGADLTGVNFTRANLSGACLVDTDFTGATFTNTTNLYNAIFCRTTMPDGSVNNSGCGSGTACCPTCLESGRTCGPGIGGACCGLASCVNDTCQCVAATCQSLGKTCGAWPDGCGATLQCGSCTAGLCQSVTCSDGTCEVTAINGQQAPGCTDSGQLCCSGTCTNTNSDDDHCGSCGNVCFDSFAECQNGTCGCLPTAHDCFGVQCMPLCNNDPEAWQDRFQFCFTEDPSRQGDCAACMSWTGCFGSLATGVAECGTMNGTCFGLPA